MKKFICLLLSVFLLFPVLSAAAAPETVSPSVLLMEKDSGKILYEKDSHKKLPPASVTKVMTLLLVMEAIENGKIKLDDKVSVSEHAAGMGGSQVFLAAGEEMSVNDLLKATTIASGNDSAVALAEFIAGSESGFVEMMNARAKELGMDDTCFKNCTGLDAEGHVTSAHDIAIMARELIKHEKIKEYSTTWMDSLRNGAFTLANTNKLIRSYQGITGLKTGSTSTAKFCLAATAKRNGMELIATIMAAPSSKERFSDASKLLDFGFASYGIYNPEGTLELNEIPVILGKKECLPIRFASSPATLVEKSKLGKLEAKLDLPDDICAPVENGQTVGYLKIFSGEEVISEIPIIASESVEKLDFIGIFRLFASKIFMK